tara:strand:+ start:443 stop:769 length:327 start_codon:yes stop_codon:yes gene_type:complete
MKIPPEFQKLFIYGSINPVVPMMFKKVAGPSGMVIYSWIRWRMWIPDYITKAKSDWVKLDNVAMNRYGYGMDRKTKNKALRKLEKAGLIDLHLVDNSGKAPQARLIIK